ncbi:MAG: ribose 5-phosphate isomerase B [Elusimicrobia bacterium RIFCSPLOWO2_01_FULL_60_11]|nr:MAG: ribose 5-phosphate isomerase B [Elusimicrobia bacterium RIFCSPLOWO2_01_FULL_60_11]
MKIAVGADHGGFERKAAIIGTLRKLGHAVTDMGTDSDESVDYPDYAAKVAGAVSRGRAERGVLICGTGIGMSIAANKFPKVRAAVVWNVKTASLAAEHNKANVLCLSGRFLKPALIPKMLGAWLATPFGGSRHERRVKKIAKLEAQACRRG